MDTEKNTAVAVTHSQAEPVLHDQSKILPKNKLIVLLCAMSFSSVLCFIDQAGVGLLFPAIGADLNAGATISWAATSAIIGSVAFQVLYGRLSDIFGRKVVYISVVLMLALSDLACGFAQNGPMLYFFRGVSGIAGGGIQALTMMIISDSVTLKERGLYQGIIGAAIGAGNLIGPFLAAAVVTHATWRAFFWAIAPSATCCAAIAYSILPNNMPSGNMRAKFGMIDYGGLLTSSSGIILLLIPISGGGAYFEWKSPMVISMLTLGSLCFVTFFIVEWRVAKLPMMPLSLFRRVPVAVLLIQNILFGATYYSQMYFLPVFFQNALQLSPLVSACLMLPIPGCQMISSILSGQYISRRERYGEVIWVGFFLWTLGQGLTCLFSRQFPIWAIALVLCITGFGIGMVFQPTLVALQAQCLKSQRAVVISNRSFMRAFGGAIGLAITAAVSQRVIKKGLPAELGHLTASAYELPNLINLNPAQIEQILKTYERASKTVFYMYVPLLGLCLLGCLLVRDKGLEYKEQSSVHAPRPEV
ncbi:major facilitator superfamily domain-containing protein [Protomyces lactucae-debilis]|uniref:Major facilitator superfamily domain-containing protein n=1 Tax=Protomyces lactucae-debilis TaxID=2754530 RepID=A0A1Y2F2S0_PROLT|nr:major facilitator superfamily domain-containing protein [Protomyces lactucae-debilis]ORY78171.1 major facilitator superfamily domain-containing protein [Protomyces lactucae-debilis]